MPSWTSRLERTIRAIGFSHEAPSSGALLLTITFAGALYGACMGTFAFEFGQRTLMVLYAAIKVPLLIAMTTVLRLPGFFVFNTIAGLRDDFGKSLRGILASQGAFTLALAGLGPITMFVYLGGVNHRWALLFNALCFTIATGFAQLVLLRRYRPLIATNSRHRAMLVVWVLLYAFVGIQMGWMMRPFVGNPAKEVTFFRDEPFSNAYVAVFNLVTRR